jgi:hypothetical protein
MKKIIFVLTIGLAVGCGITRPTAQANDKSLNIKHSEILIASPDTSVVWILNTQHGNLIANTWMSGAYGTKTRVVVVNQEEFEQLSKTTVPCTCSSSWASSNKK